VSNLAWFFVALAIVLALIAGYAASLLVRRRNLEARIGELEERAH
jgi:CcmD family protein